jgi:predicted nucleic acid-binding protein
MANSPNRVSWDACTWIALIQEERITEDGIDRVTRCRSVLEQAKKARIEIVTSALSLSEVCKNKDIKDGDASKIAAFFENDYILLVNVDKDVGERAREIMMAGYSKLKPADACHLATAALTPFVTEMHTFDERLLNLNSRIRKVDGSPLKICLPDVGSPLPPLLKK